MKTFRPSDLFLMVLLPFAATVQAADPAPARTGNTLSIPGGKPTGQVAGKLTRDQLRRCLTDQKNVEELEARAAQAQSELQSQKAEIARGRTELEQAGAALDAERASVDLTQAAAVDAFNAKLAARRDAVARHEAFVESYNARLQPYNEQVETLNVQRAGWVGNCSGRPYDEADYFAIQRGK